MGPQLAEPTQSHAHGQMGMMLETAATLVFTNISELARCTGPARGGGDADPASILPRGAVAVRGGVIV